MKKEREKGKALMRNTTVPATTATLFYIFLFTLSFLSTSCHSKRPDISGIKINLSTQRFEQDLFTIRHDNRDSAIAALQKSYGDFFIFYFNDFAHAWNFTADSSQSWKDSVVKYVQDPVMRALHDSVLQRFTDLSAIKKQLSTSIAYLKYYFPNTAVPHVITLINGPGRGAFTYGDSILCIALDDYMGPRFSYYRYQDIPQYLLRKFTPDYMVPNCMQVMITAIFPFDPTGKNLLDAMIYNGKIMYLRSRVMPDAADSLITGFSNADLKWCADNEPEIWKFFISKNLLYSKDPLEYLKYVNDGPNTSGMPPAAPGNVGSWCGWRIVDAYMKHYPETTLPQLMAEQDAQKILTGSKYKP